MEKRGKTFAISGLPGAGSSATSKALASRVGLDFFSAGQLFKDISTGVLLHLRDLFK